MNSKIQLSTGIFGLIGGLFKGRSNEESSDQAETETQSAWKWPIPEYGDIKVAVYSDGRINVVSDQILTRNIDGKEMAITHNPYGKDCHLFSPDAFYKWMETQKQEIQEGSTEYPRYRLLFEPHQEDKDTSMIKDYLLQLLPEDAPMTPIVRKRHQRWK